MAGTTTRGSRIQVVTMVAVTVACGALATGCSGPDVGEVAEEQPAFASCLDDLGASVEGSGDWSRGEAQEFWTRPGTLDCAIDELDEGSRADALDAAFVDYGDERAVDDRDGERAAQLEVVGSWAATTAEATSVEETVQRAVPLLSATWMADAGYGATNAGGLAVTLSALRAAGELPSYEAYLAERPDESDSTALLVSWSKIIGGKTPPEFRRQLDLTNDLVDEVRGTT